jgi:hypothetical protein
LPLPKGRPSSLRSPSHSPNASFASSSGSGGGAAFCSNTTRPSPRANTGQKKRQARWAASRNIAHNRIGTISESVLARAVLPSISTAREQEAQWCADHPPSGQKSRQFQAAVSGDVARAPSTDCMLPVDQPKANSALQHVSGSCSPVPLWPPNAPRRGSQSPPPGTDARYPCSPLRAFSLRDKEPNPISMKHGRNRTDIGGGPYRVGLLGRHFSPTLSWSTAVCPGSRKTRPDTARKSPDQTRARNWSKCFSHRPIHGFEALTCGPTVTRCRRGDLEDDEETA